MAYGLDHDARRIGDELGLLDVDVVAAVRARDALRTELLGEQCSGAVFAAMSNVDFEPAMIDILVALQPVVQDLATEGCTTRSAR